MSAALRPRKTPRQERARATVEFLLEAAAHVFGELGYARATTNKIADRAGVSIGSLYQYFPSKDALLVALAERHLDEGLAAARTEAARLREADVDADTLAEVLVAAYVDLNTGPRGDSAIHRVIYDEAPRTPEVLEVLDRLHRFVAGEVEHHLRRLGLDAGDPGLSAWTLVRTLDAVVHQVVLRPPDGRTREQCAAEAVRLCRGHLRELTRGRGPAGAPAGPVPPAG